MISVPITTMGDEVIVKKGKKLQPVNGFKAPPEWYEIVKRIAEERYTTIGGAIQIVFNIGLPLYENSRKAEIDSLKQQYEKLGITADPVDRPTAKPPSQQDTAQTPPGTTHKRAKKKLKAISNGP